ncbi:hypothetical protein [Streptomyces buecherae]|uniref:hypothetical protein n=1 Tax=Streptomyces buecherae TaxID=2763006 RepID=UPI00364A553D
MDNLVKFFVAPDDASARSALQAGPGRGVESVSFSYVDPGAAVVKWECLLIGGNFVERIEAGEPRYIVAGFYDGPIVFEVPPPLTAALADAAHSRLSDVAATWSFDLAERGEFIDPEAVDEVMKGLAALASSAQRQNQSVYCWAA